MYGPIAVFNLKTGKWEETPVTDAWVLANTRQVQIFALPTEIAADGEDAARVVVLLTSGYLVSVEEKRTIAEDVTITLIADGQRHKVALTAGMGVVTVKAVEAGSYEITADGFAGATVTITAEAVKEDAPARAQDAMPLAEDQTVIVLGKRQLAEKARPLSNDVLKVLTSKEFKNKTADEKIDALTEMVIHLARIQQG